MTVPTSSRNTLRHSRNTRCEWMCVCRPLDERLRDARVDEVVGQARRDREDQQDAADERDAVAHDADDVLPGRQVSMNEALHDERVERRDGRRLGQRHDAGDVEPQHDHRQQQFALRVPHRLRALRLRRTACAARSRRCAARTPSAATRPSITRPGSRPPMNRCSIGASRGCWTRRSRTASAAATAETAGRASRTP